ncbi:MAG TPA: rRNA adenine N-6-methyltransferase family protein [Gammaproteobacteria bacterium]|nr:methyltransferase domain-containing protein [Xanthomonadales bacterium]MCB1593814.1 methyltransferase domain-containing protein [Xanthomonadales bacterium]HOP23281.1 rRNA adenine N-6-methyltransferase family protein [Gammaproteobacteria bacterium]HPI95038.1 rRNA adenine N-6-methyltransferase family protein [Gammaproteobacteria bacterium]
MKTKQKIKGNSLKESAVFLKNAIFKPKEIAYVFPSSRALIRSIAIRSGLSEAKKIIELGPGTGGTTKGILSEMREDAKLCAVEINKNFVEFIKKNIPDERLSVCHDGAQNLAEIIKQQGWQHADVIISGIPFSTLPKGMGEEIMQSIYENIRPSGLFVAYQFRDRVGKLATPVFGEPSSYLEIKNLPPMRIYVWQKSE